MRNLCLRRERKRCVSSTSNHRLVDVVCLEDNSRVLLTANGDLALVAEQNDQLIWEVCLSSHMTKVEKDADVDEESWFDVTYVDQVLVALSHSGAIMVVQLDTGIAELVGEFDNGICAAAWSVDRQILILVTKTNSETENGLSTNNTVLVTMNTHFDVLAEAPIGNIKVNSPVYLCWTSMTAPNSSSYLFALSSEDNSDEAETRKIRIYRSDTLQMHAIGRTEDGSGKLVPNLSATPLAWSGSRLLASIQRKGRHKQLVALVEPNGLRHGEFVLRDDATLWKVVDLEWSVSDYVLLAVVLRCSHDKSVQSKVQLWFRSNYHWYLKREMIFKESSVCVRFTVNTNGFNSLLVILGRKRCWIEFDFRWDNSTLFINCLESSTDAVVVDGCQINVTHMEKSLTPPPMFCQTLTMDNPVSEIGFRVRNYESVSSSSVAVVLLSNGTWVVLNTKNQPRIQCTGSLSCESISLQLDPLSFRGLIVVQQDDSHIRCVAIATSWDTPGRDYLVELNLTLNASSCYVDVSETHQLEHPCWTLSPWIDSADGALLQLDNGTFLEYSILEDGKGLLIPSLVDPFLEPCPWLVALRHVETFTSRHSIDIAMSDHRKRLIVGVSDTHRLYLHDMLLADSVSSFVVSLENEYLSYVTAGSHCVLHFLSLVDLCNLNPLLTGTDEYHALVEGYEPRSVERGSQIVALLTGRPSAVLQMPRGNLECIYPRALVVRNVVLAIYQGSYRQALESMRKYKVDLNLMVDMKPWHFLKYGAMALIEEIESIDHLNLFIASLQNYNSTEMRYPIPFWLSNQHADDITNSVDFGKPFDYTTKVNQVCQKLRSVMLNAEMNLQSEGGRIVSESHFLLPILSTFAKEDPPQLGQALQMIQANAIKSHVSSENSTPLLFSEKSQSSIQYLAFLADYELLFETALGLYDYDLARAVARNSQMDPKMYLPLLRRYSEMPMFYGYFLVDQRLQRFDSALRNLVQSRKMDEAIDANGEDGNSFGVCLELIKEHRLYQLGLELFAAETNRHQIIMTLLGDYLLESHQPATALSLFLMINPIDCERCVTAALQAEDWRSLFSLRCIRENQTRQAEVARCIASSLSKNDHRIGEAARILLEYASDITGAVDLLIRSRAWSEAKRIAYMLPKDNVDGCVQDDLVDLVVGSSFDYAESSIQDLLERRDAFRHAMERYNEVLMIRKVAMVTESDRGEDRNYPCVDDDGSLFSIASNASKLSTTSTSSTASGASVLSSVISVKSTNSFSVSGFDACLRHKSRFNKLGRDRQKAKKKSIKKGRKVRPGSEEELQELVQALQSNCINDDLSATISDCVLFLLRNDKAETARALYVAYQSLCNCVEKAQQDRIDSLQIYEDNAQRHLLHFTHSVEDKVNSLKCPSLSSTLHNFFAYLPIE